MENFNLSPEIVGNYFHGALDAVVISKLINGMSLPIFSPYVNLRILRDMKEEEVFEVINELTKDMLLELRFARNVGDHVLCYWVTEKNEILSISISVETQTYVSLVFYTSVQQEFPKTFLEAFTNRINDFRLMSEYKDEHIKDVTTAFASISAKNGVNLNYIISEPANFADIKQNYTKTVQRKMKRLIEDLKTLETGLVLFSGEPGTGKTYLIRSLLTEPGNTNRGVICLPATKFLADTSALMDAMMRIERPIIILEDMGALFERQNKGDIDIFANLLNLTDGMFSNLKKAIFVLSFNVDIKEMDKAITRPGRCIANISVPLLSAVEARRLLPKSKAKLLKNKDYSLAEVYAIKNDVEYESDTKSSTIGLVAVSRIQSGVNA